MSEPTSHGDLMAQFLGVPPGTKDPATILGVQGGALDDDRIVAGLRQRLADVSMHAEGGSPEADEVRLLLHAAAARLLDPARRAAYEQRAGATPTAPAPPSAGAATVLMTLAMHGGWNRDSLRRLTLIAESQGITPEELVATVHSLAQRPSDSPAGPEVARAPEPIVRAGQNTAVPRPAPVRPPVSTPVPPPPRLKPPSSFQPQRQNAAPAAPGPGDGPAGGWSVAPSGVPRQDPGTGVAKVVVGVVGAGVLLMGVAAVAIVIVLTGRVVPKGGKAPAGANGTAPATATQTPTPVAPVAAANEAKAEPVPPPRAPGPRKSGVGVTRVGDFEDVLRALRDSVAGWDVDPDAALAAFEEACAEAGRRWPESKPDARLAAVNAELDMLYRVGSDPARASRAVGALDAGVRALAAQGEPSPGAISPAVWSAGVLARLSRERDLPSTVREAVRGSFTSAFAAGRAPGEESFSSGAVTFALSLPARLAPLLKTASPENAAALWSAWAKAVDALGGDDQAQAARLKLAGLERIMVDGPEPTQSQGAFEAMTMLTCAVTWRQGDPSRVALLRWFDLAGVSIADLHCVTTALASKSGAEGVDYSMILSANAADSARGELGARFASVWGLASAENRETLASKWGEAASRALALADTPDSAGAWAARAMRLCRLNEAATRLSRGDLDGLAEAIRAGSEDPPSSKIVTPLPPVSGLPDPEVLASQSWAVKYLAAGQRVPARRELLAAVNAAPSALEASVLVDEACRGSPYQVRADARAVVVRYASEATIARAMLDASNWLPPTLENAELARTVGGASVPSHRDPRFRVGVRRVMVERLLQLLAGQGDLGVIDRAADDLAASYAARTPRGDSSGAEPAAALVKVAPPTPEAAARGERGRLQKEAEAALATGREPFTLAELENRRSARARVAVGKVQAFAAEQVGACELLAFITVAEAPGREDAVREVMVNLAQRRRAASGVFEQFEAVERASLRLWTMRLGVTSP